MQQTSTTDPGATWAGTYRFSADRLYHPDTVDEVRRIVAGSSAIRALGSRHSFTDIADSPGDLVSLEGIHAPVEIDAETLTARVGAGARYGAVAEELHRHGYALANLASLPHISVAGSVATATHGSGVGNGSLATSVAAMELVTASGDLLTVSRETASDFDGMVVGLGALGVVTSVTLDIEPAFMVGQRAFVDLPWSRLIESFDEIVSAAYSVSVFTDWQGETAPQVWLKSRTDRDPVPGESFFGAQPATKPLHMLPGVGAENCTEQLGVPGPAHERLSHFKIGFTPSNGEELQSEYLFDRADAVAALTALKDLLGGRRLPLHMAEVRTVAADEQWLSPAYHRDTVGVHFTWRKEPDAVYALLPEIEEALKPLAARPHWGKLFTTSAEELSRLYPRMQDFRDLAARFDPDGTFRNAFLDRVLGARA